MINNGYPKRTKIIAIETMTIPDFIMSLTEMTFVEKANAFEGVEPSLLRRASATFEAESEEARLARRKRNWIANVEYIESST